MRRPLQQRHLPATSTGGGKPIIFSSVCALSRKAITPPPISRYNQLATVEGLEWISLALRLAHSPAHTHAHTQIEDGGHNNIVTTGIDYCVIIRLRNNNGRRPSRRRFPAICVPYY